LSLDSQWRCRVEPIDRLTDVDARRWAELAERAADPNAFLSPSFVGPAARRLDPADAVAAWLIEQRRDDGNWVLQGVAVMRDVPGDRDLPLPHAAGYVSLHSFLGGVLLDARDRVTAARAMYAAWCRVIPAGVVLPRCDVEALTQRALADAARARDRCVLVRDAFERATMQPARQTVDAVRERLPSHTKRYLSAAQKADPDQRLALRILRGRTLDVAAIERHLELEHAGWKGEQGTSLRARPAEEAFFREVFHANAAADRAVLVELLLGNKVIHSSSNLLQGAGGFAFKVGFDPAHAKLSPGILGEVGFLLAVREALPEVTVFDSGSTADSFIAGLWPDRRCIGTLVLSTSRRADLVLATQGALRRCKHRLAAWRRQGVSDAG
jgi:hypothetical protein